MKVLFDHQIFETQNYGGISRYFQELISSLSNMEGLECTLPVKFSSNEHLLSSLLNEKAHANKKPDYYNQFLSGLDFPGKWKLYNFLYKDSKSRDISLMNREYSLSEIAKKDFDIFHPTYYDNYFEKHIGDKPFVITVHDLIGETFPDQSTGNISYLQDCKKSLINNASAIIAVSNNTKNDIIRYYGIDDEKITVIYHGNSLINKKPVQVKGLPEKYLLFVGNRSKYKNFTRFISAIKPVLSDDQDLFLVCTGKEFNLDEKQLINELELSNKIIQKYVDDSGLAYLYTHAAAFIFPSLYEGFGIPILEAFGFGCPAILSNTSSLPEIGDDAAQYFDPEDLNSILQTIICVLNNESLRTGMIKKGYERQKLFSWEETALKTKKVYEKVLS